MPSIHPRNAAAPWDAEREPQLQRAERARVLQRPLDGVADRVPAHVGLLVPEGALELALPPDQDQAAALLQAEPLVGVEGDRVGPVQAAEGGSGALGGRRGDAVRAVHVKPHVVL